MRTPRLFNLQRSVPFARKTRRGFFRVLQFSGAALALAGCGSEPAPPIDRIIPLQPAEAQNGKPAVSAQTESLRAKARALTLADPEEAKAQALIDSAMLSQAGGQGANPQAAKPATQRDEGAVLISSTRRLDALERAPPPSEPQAASQGDMVRRLRELAEKFRVSAPRPAAPDKEAPATNASPYGALATDALAPASRTLSLPLNAGAGAK